MCHALNPRLAVRDDGVLTLLPADGGGEPVAIGKHTEGLQFYARLTCGEHYHLCTLHSINHPRKLMCRLCEPQPLLRAARVAALTRPEVGMHQAMARLGVAADFYPQVKVPFWHGLVDFYHPTLNLVVQVDGPRHFAAEEGVVHQERTQSARDAAMLASSWRAGAAVLRVRDFDVDGPAAAAALLHAISHKTQHPAWPLVALTPGFAPHLCHWPKGDRSPRAFLEMVLAQIMTKGSEPCTAHDSYCNTYIGPPPTM